MAEYKKTWAKRFKTWRQKENMTIEEFVIEKMSPLGQGHSNNVKKYKAVESGRAAPSNYQKSKLMEERT